MKATLNLNIIYKSLSLF